MPANRPCSTGYWMKNGLSFRRSPERPATSSKKQSISKESVSGSSTRPASVRPTTGWSAWASNVRCSALPKPVSLSAYSTSRHSPPRHLLRSEHPVPAPDFEIPQSATLLTVANKIDLYPELVLPQGLSVCPLKTDKGLIHSVAPCYKQSEAMRSNRGDIVVSNGRHFEVLTIAHEALGQALHGLCSGLPADL